MIHSTARKLLSAAMALAVALPMDAAALWAADEVELQDLFSIVSQQTVQTATLSPIPVSKSPGTVSLLTAREIDNYGALNLDEAIAQLPGVDVRMTPMGFAAFIRGFGGSPFQEGIHYQIDGLLYNSPDKGGSSANPGYSSFPVPIEMVKQVEVIREPISSLYGPNAFSGVVNVITKDGQDFGNGGRVVARVSDRNLGRDLQRYAAAYGNKVGDWDFSGGGEFYRQRGPMRMNENSVIFDSSINAKVKWKDFTAKWYSRGEESEPFVLSSTNTKKTEQDVYLAGVSYDKKITEKAGLSARSSYLRRNGTNCMVCHNPGSFKSTEASDDRESFQRFYQQVHAKVKTERQDEWTFGAEFMQDREHMDASVLTQARVINDTYSGFLQYVRALRPDLTATLGIRQDFSEWSNAGDLLSPRALLVYTPNDRTTVRTGYTRAHRLPTFHDLYIFMKFLPIPPGSATGERFVMGNPNLEPETIDTFNLGTDYWINNKSVVKVSGYYSMIENMIDRISLTNPETNSILKGRLPNGDPTTNTGSVPARTSAQYYINMPTLVHVAGAELEYMYKPFRFLELSANYSFKNVSYSRRGVDFIGSSNPPNAPRHLAGGSVTAFPLKNLMMNVSGRYRDEFYASHIFQLARVGSFFGFQEAKEVFFLDFHVRYALPWGFSVSLIGRNMLDQAAEDWRVATDTRQTTGKNLFLQLAYDFGGPKAD